MSMAQRSPSVRPENDSNARAMSDLRSDQSTARGSTGKGTHHSAEERDRVAVGAEAANARPQDPDGAERGGAAEGVHDDAA